MEFTGFEQGLLFTALGIFAAATFVAGGVIAGRRPGRNLRALRLAGTIVLTILGIVLWARLGRPPLVQRAEVLIFSGWCIAAGTVLLASRFDHAILVLVSAPTVALLCLFGWLISLRPDVSQPDTLHPGVLAHILIAVLGLAAFTFAAGVGEGDSETRSSCVLVGDGSLVSDGSVVRDSCFGELATEPGRVFLDPLGFQPSGGTASTMLPHCGHARMAPMTSRLRTASRARQVVQVI
jgi:hypothetical protein